MLVVSRKQDQSVVFPALGIRVEILKMTGKTVRVGVQAPDDVQILRGELAGTARPVKDDRSPNQAHANPCRVPVGMLSHELRNRLNQASLAMNLTQKQLAAGRVQDAEATLAIAIQAFADVNQAMASPGSDKVPVGHPGATAAIEAFDDVSPRPQRKRALIVEDDANERVLLASYLRASGYEIDTAEDGQAALEYLADHKPDAVVIDMEMPRVDGRQCVQEIRSDYHFDDVKLFVVSGREQNKSQIATGDRGVQRWFQKPICPEELVSELASSLN